MEGSLAAMRHEFTECNSSLKEALLLFENSSKSIEQFSDALDLLSQKIQKMELADAGRRTWEEKKKDLERQFNNRLIVLFTAIGALAAAVAAWKTWGG